MPCGKVPTCRVGKCLNGVGESASMACGKVPQWRRGKCLNGVGESAYILT